ncbi:hypothetical protein POM88_052532 [Heracleum sosnowskyi]|uniref:Uncharacterized protein n=1 Tax=Heracleum sosnowskyi TaxID=360622 RepID=A0AAD8GS71_9APIA|nr:hypothetical protein POM88_052532 [Heracleum sosnowskyi]
MDLGQLAIVLFEIPRMHEEISRMKMLIGDGWGDPHEIGIVSGAIVNVVCTKELARADLEDSTVWLWNVEKNSFLSMFSGHNSSVSCGEFTPDGKIICTTFDDATLRIWNPKHGKNIHVIEGDTVEHPNILLIQFFKFRRGYQYSKFLCY